jgi:predicted TIM-barrel fold metal-dependent hydrolase
LVLPRPYLFGMLKYELDGRDLNETVDAELEALPEDMRARLARIAQLIEDKGQERVGD